MSPARLDALCATLHDAYEAAAAREGWETQARSRVAWDAVPEANKATMRAAVTALLAELAKKIEDDTAELPNDTRDCCTACRRRGRREVADWLRPHSPANAKERR